MSKTVFNQEKVDFTKQPMFFGEYGGIQRYDEFKQWLYDSDLDEKYVKASMKILNSITDYMMSEDKHTGWGWFKEYTRILDLRRNQSILDVVPEYAPYFKDKALQTIDDNIRESQNERQQAKT